MDDAGERLRMLRNSPRFGDMMNALRGALERWVDCYACDMARGDPSADECTCADEYLAQCAANDLIAILEGP